MKAIQEKIIILWVVFLLGTLFHTQLGLMPLFHGIDIANNALATTNLSETANILWGMLAFFAIPMLVIVSTALTNSRRYRVFHFGLTIVYSLLNFLHVISEKHY